MPIKNRITFLKEINHMTEKWFKRIPKPLLKVL